MAELLVDTNHADLKLVAQTNFLTGTNAGYFDGGVLTTGRDVLPTSSRVTSSARSWAQQGGAPNERRQLALVNEMKTFFVKLFACRPPGLGRGAAIWNRSWSLSASLQSSDGRPILQAHPGQKRGG